MMAKKVLRDFTAPNQSASFISNMIGETTDQSNTEHVVIRFRWVDNDLEVHEDVIGLYKTEYTEAVTLLTIIHDVLHTCRLNFTITEASAMMSEGKAGVAKLILDE